jgi:hypothetical protein
MSYRKCDSRVMFGHGHGKMLNYNKAKENRSAKKLPAPEKYGFIHCFIALLFKAFRMEKTPGEK